MNLLGFPFIWSVVGIEVFQTDNSSSNAEFFSISVHHLAEHACRIDEGELHTICSGDIPTRDVTHKGYGLLVFADRDIDSPVTSSPPAKGDVFVQNRLGFSVGEAHRGGFEMV